MDCGDELVRGEGEDRSEAREREGSTPSQELEGEVAKDGASGRVYVEGSTRLITERTCQYEVWRQSTARWTYKLKCGDIPQLEV